MPVDSINLDLHCFHFFGRLIASTSGLFSAILTRFLASDPVSLPLYNFGVRSCTFNYFLDLYLEVIVKG